MIIEDGRLLCIRKEDEQGLYALLPGGGQEPGEPLHEALRRECREEVNAEIEIHDLRYVRDYISTNHEFADTEPFTHQLDMMFFCTLQPGAQVGLGSVPDTGQIDVDWIPLGDLVKARLYPLALARVLASPDAVDTPVYLGDVN
jgi:ADP-ribose pyrophosphatase YjhB (NUDIX family)